MPSTDRELLPLAENKELLYKRNVYAAVSEPDFLNTVRNKYFLHTFLDQNSLPTLPLVDITARTVEFPVIGKPCFGWGGRGIHILNSRDEMSNLPMSHLTENYIWQPYLREFDEYSIDCAINFDGSISEIIIRQRIKTIGGFAVIMENVNDAYITDLVNNLLEVMRTRGACGIFNIQVIKKSSHYYITDVNPRIGTSAVFAYELGINFPLFLCSYIKPDIYVAKPSTTSKRKLRMVRYLDEFWIERDGDDQIKAVVFDLDDTLINQKLWIIDKLEIVWSQFREVLPEKRTFLLKAVQLIEEGNRGNLFDVLSELYKFPKDLREQLIIRYREAEPQTCPVFPDTLPVLNALRKRGLRLALLTDNPPVSQKQKIKICNFSALFDTIVYSREFTQEKPDRSLFHEVAKRLNTHTEVMAMVGDNLYKDIMGSLEANYKRAYWIVREGTFYNFDQALLGRLTQNNYRFSKIRSLRSLLWNLP
jgi:FMN phosphatase YigB (HAD superfamily)